MMQIVSSPWQFHYYQVSDYSTIDRALMNLTSQLCAVANSSVLPSNCSPSTESTIATSPTVTTATTVTTAATTSDGQIFNVDLLRLVFQIFGQYAEY
jgi:hypothetical protein